MADQTGQAIHEVFMYLCVPDAGAAIAFYEQAFGATEDFRLTSPEGHVVHAEVKLGPAMLMLADEFPESGMKSPLSLGGTGVRIHLHVQNVDALARRAVEAGATMLTEPTDEVHGERQCRLRDPFGHEWLLGHQVEAISRDEMRQRVEGGS